MKKKTRKRSLCLLLAAALLLTSIPFDMTTSSKAEEKGTVVRDGEYTTGIFAGEYGIDQLFDYVMMTSTLKGLHMMLPGEQRMLLPAISLQRV